MASITSFTATPSSVADGQAVVLNWVATADSFSINDGATDTPATGTSQTVFPSANTTYTLTATDTAGSVTSTAAVTVTVGGSQFGGPTWGDTTWDDPVPVTDGGGGGGGGPVIGSFTATGSTSPGSSVTLSWSVPDGSTVSISSIGTVTGSSITVNPLTTTTYTLTATDGSGSSSISVTVTVPVAPSGENIRYHQIRRTDRYGAGKQFATADGTGRFGDLAGYSADGTLTRVTVGSSLSVGSSPSDGDSLVGVLSGGPVVYGQVPRGTVDGSNRFFQLDYAPASPYMWLVVNGIEQKPPIDGTAANPDPDYTVSGFTVTYTAGQAPLATDWHYVKYYRGPDAALIPPLTRVSATAFLTTAHYPDPASDQWGGGAGFNDTISLFSLPSWYRDASQWDKRTDSKLLIDLDFTQLITHLDDNTLYLLVEQFHLGDNAATGPGPFDDEYWIYDAYISIAMSDGTSQIWRPTATATAGTVHNPEFAIDGDTSTYAVILVGAYSPGGYDGAALELYGWIRTA